MKLTVIISDGWIITLGLWLQNGRESLGDVMHRYITSDQFSVECLLDCLEFSSEHQALEIANRLEASIYMWRQKAATRPKSSTARSNPKSSSLGAVKERVIDAEKRELFAERAESLLICLKQRFPGLTQTTLDMSKIQFNKVKIVLLLLLGKKKILPPFRILTETLNVTGYWEIYSGELFQSAGESCVQHCCPYWRCSVRRRPVQELRSVLVHISRDGCSSMFSALLEHSWCYYSFQCKLLTVAIDQANAGGEVPLLQQEGSWQQLWREESPDGLFDWRAEGEQ